MFVQKSIRERQCLESMSNRFWVLFLNRYILLLLVFFSMFTNLFARDTTITVQEKLSIMFFLYEDLSIAYENINTRPYEFLDLFSEEAQIVCDILPINDFNAMVTPMEYYELVSNTHDRLFRINSVTIVPLGLEVVSSSQNKKVVSVDVEKYINASSKNDVTYNQIKFRHKVDISIQDSLLVIEQIEPVGDQGKMLIINHSAGEKPQKLGLENVVINDKDTIDISQNNQTIYRFPSQKESLSIKPNHHYYYGKMQIKIDGNDFSDGEHKTNHTGLFFTPKKWFFNFGAGGAISNASNAFIGSTTFNPNATDLYSSGSTNQLGLLNAKVGTNIFVAKKHPIFISVTSGFIYYSRLYDERLDRFQNSRYETDDNGFDYIRNYAVDYVNSNFTFNNLIFTHSFKVLWGVNKKYSLYIEPEIAYSMSAFQTINNNTQFDGMRVTGLYQDDQTGISYVLGNDDVYNVLDFGFREDVQESVDIDLTEVLFFINYGISLELTSRSMIEFGFTSILWRNHTVSFKNDASLGFLNLQKNMNFGFFGGGINIIPRVNYIFYL